MKERMMILEMVSSGKINPDEALVLLQALGEDDETGAGLEMETGPFGLTTVGITGNPEDEFSPDEPDVESPGISFAPLQPLTPMPPLPPLAVEGAPAHTHLARRSRTPDAAFAAAAVRAGFEFSSRQLLRLQALGVTLEELEALRAAGRPDWAEDELVEMLACGVKPEYILALRKLGLEAGPGLYCRLVEHGASVEDIRRLLELELDGLRPEHLLELFEHNTDLDALQLVREAGPLTARQAIEIGIYGIDREYAAGMQALELEDLTPGRLIDMKIHEVELDEAQHFMELGLPGLNARRLIDLKIHEVEPEYARGIQELQLPELSLAALVDLRIHEVSLGAARRAKALTGDELTAGRLVEGAVQGWLYSL